MACQVCGSQHPDAVQPGIESVAQLTCGDGIHRYDGKRIEPEDTLHHDNWQAEVLSFWFDELTPEDWFSGKTDVDDRIRARFADLPNQVARQMDGAEIDDPMQALAAIIVLDQFTRNLHRGKAEAFFHDALAIELARNAVDAELDAGMTEAQKQFLYMPFMHSEIVADQERCVALFRSLGKKDSLDYAIEHRDIIARFGRFPHRNRALGRTSTDAETEFLKSHKGFGQ